MNIQTEHLENHIARLTVEIEPERLEKAKQATVRKLAQRVNIPGFRKGKAPYNIIVRYLGEAAILEETVETLGQEVYRETLNQVEVEPYGPGQLEDFKIEPKPTFVYTLPKQPTVKLNDYRAVRLDYEEPKIEDRDVDHQIRLLLEEEALIEESHRPVEMGNRVTVDIHSYFLGEASTEDGDTEDAVTGSALETAQQTVETTADDDAEAHNHVNDEEEEEQHDHDGKPEREDEVEGYIHEHDMPIRLIEGDDEPVGPGFSAALVGAKVGEDRVFEITYPETKNVNEQVAGRTVRFYVTIKKIETMTLPVLNDEFAARFTERFALPDEGRDETGEDSPDAQQRLPLTLLQLRMRVRELLQEHADRVRQDEYAQKVLAEITKTAELSYPDDIVEDQLTDILTSVENRLKSQGLSLEIFQRITGRTTEMLRDEYRSQAIEAVERSLILADLFRAEKLSVTDEDIRQEMLRITMQFSDEQAAAVLQSLNNPQMLNSLANRLMQEKVYERVASIGRGQAPDLPEDNPEDREEAASSAEAEGETAPAEAQDQPG